MAVQETPQKKSNKKIILIISILLVVACLCILVIGVGGYLIFGDQIQDWLPGGNQTGLKMFSSASDGNVSGEYQYYNTAGGHLLYFTVSKEGKASFNLDGDSSPGVLTVDLLNEGEAMLVWDGITLDGVGPLTLAEQDAFDNLMASDLMHGLKYIPLDAGCQGEDKISPLQVATLLVPLQMRFKYQITDRQAEAQHIGSFSKCSYGQVEADNSGGSSVIQLSPSSPVPVVIGYFPFDEDGAVEYAGTGTKTACTDYYPLSGVVYRLPLENGPDEVTPIGPCGALCRGACGADCDLDNCSLTIEGRCQKDEGGKNTGFTYRARIYDCGLHQGCINHDDCYDICNISNGCNTWAAAICRHSVSPVLPTFGAGLCDQTAIAEYGPLPAIWMYGFGYMPERKTYIYVDESWGDEGYRYNLDACPLDAPDPSEIKETPDSKPQNENGQETSDKDTDKDASENTTQSIWRLVNTEVNPFNAQTQFVGGGATPGYYVEPRFEGKSLSYTVSESSFTIHDKEVDHEYVYHDVTIIVNFDTPPTHVLPGELINLTVNFSKQGNVNEGGSGILAQFWYTSDDIYVEPKIFFYAPWSDGFDGSSSDGYAISFPSEGGLDSFTINASLWNNAPCLVTWTFQLLDGE